MRSQGEGSQDPQGLNQIPSLTTFWILYPLQSGHLYEFIECLLCARHWAKHVTNLFFTPALEGRCWHSTHFTDEEPEADSNDVAGLGSA